MNRKTATYLAILGIILLELQGRYLFADIGGVGMWYEESVVVIYLSQPYILGILGIILLIAYLFSRRTLSGMGSMGVAFKNAVWITFVALGLSALGFFALLSVLFG